MRVATVANADTGGRGVGTLRCWHPRMRGRTAGHGHHTFMAKGTTSVEPAGRAEKATAARVKARQWAGLFEEARRRGR